MNAPLACRWQVKCGSHTHTQKQNQKTHTQKKKKTHTHPGMSLAGPCMCVCIFLRVSITCAHVSCRVFVVLLHTFFVSRILLRAYQVHTRVLVRVLHMCFRACVSCCVCAFSCVCLSDVLVCLVVSHMSCCAQQILSWASCCAPIHTHLRGSNSHAQKTCMHMQKRPR